MKKISLGIIVAAVACALALCMGCSSQAASSSAAAGSSASAESSQTATATTGTGEAVDPANLTDGEYMIGVTLEGGSGKATVESPAKLIVGNGEKTAVIVWSSPNYDLMIVDGKEYYPVPREGNSTFEVPVSAFDADLAIQAETTAMSEPHLIDYTLHFDSSTITK